MNRATNAGIADAAVSIQRSSGETHVATRTDSAGRFRFQIDSSGGATSVTSITAQKIGFQAATVSLPRDWAGDSLVVLLDPIARLPTTTVNAAVEKERKLVAAGFYERRRQGLGKFLDSADVERLTISSTPALLRPYLKGCTRIFVDGIPLEALRDVDPRTIIGVEIYASNIEAPERFWNPIQGPRCGSIVVWRRN